MHPQPATMLSFETLGHTYHGSSGDVEALRALTFSLDTGQALSLIGPSGCGKSTALLVAAGLLAPTSGRVLVEGQPVTGPRFSTGLILQDFGLMPWKTVFDNAALGLAVRHMKSGERRERTAQALEQVGLLDFAQNYPAELSGGMRQRLALARVLALEVDLLLMDEPLSAVDALLREGLQDLLLDLWHQRAYTQVLVTHSIDEAVYLGRRVAVMGTRPGTIVAIIDNPAMGAPDYRNAPEYFACCRQVREALDGAAGAAASAAPATTAAAAEAGTRTPPHAPAETDKPSPGAPHA